jgi:murein DD-endopeptidase MepM/ murein hydrolase activator NlpD
MAIVAAMLGACSPASEAATRTPVLAGPSRAPSAQSALTATPTLAPFRIDFPAQFAPPVTGWRPPLYPVPWAVSPYDHFYFARPIGADQVNWPLANYRYGGVFFDDVVHTGVDIDAPYGTRILAAGPGTVVWADWGLFLEAPGALDDPYGQAVVLRMDFGRDNLPLYSVYAHMSRIIAVLGQHVETGDVLGLVGDTGATTGPHVHFEVRWGENSFHYTYNPELWMAPPEGWGVLVGRVTDEHNKTLQQLDVFVQNTQTGPTRLVKTYGSGPTNADPYYNENLVMGDLPAGLYKITLSYDDRDQQEWLSIYPGQVTYFTFKGGQGFSLGPPPPKVGSFATPSPP